MRNVFLAAYLTRQWLNDCWDYKAHIPQGEWLVSLDGRMAQRRFDMKFGVTP